ncbi:MAG TPA: glycogen debranching N-terminal domain-containing protein, partial [Candidatus Binatus sp.]|nr:glycogen debranching N-terminal domain-containing protein [Candidatus Binatus sp.]
MGEEPLSDRPARSRGERKAQVLTRHSASSVGSIADAVVIKDGEPFFVCPPDGQIPISGEHSYGLYHHDTRFLSGYELTIGGARGNSLAATSVLGNRGVLELTTPEIDLGDGRTIAKERLAIRWTRQLDGDRAQLTDTIELRNFDADGARLPLRFRFWSGFEDIFEVRGLLDERPGTLHDPSWDADTLVFRYDGKDGVCRRLRVSTDPTPTHGDEPAFELAIEVPSHGRAQVQLRVQIEEQLRPGAAPIERRTDREPGGRATNRRAVGGASTSSGDDWPVTVTSDSLTLNGAMARSLEDLVTLRGELDGQRYYAAGVPWFSTLFGRDSLISAYQTLAFDPRITTETLRLLASRQGTKDDDFRDEQPGKILPELRIGELAR